MHCPIIKLYIGIHYAMLLLQIDKLLQAASNIHMNQAEESERSSLAYKPNIDALLDDDEEDESDSDSTRMNTKRNSNSTEVYRAPRLSATPYEVFEQSAQAKEKKESKLKKILSRSQILREEQVEQSSRPTLVKEMLPHMEALAAEDKERQQHEEKNFVRLTLSKKDKQRREGLRKQARSAIAFSSLENFDGVEAALQTHDDDSDGEDTHGSGGIEFSGKRARSLAEFEKHNNKGQGSKRQRGSDSNIDGDDGLDVRSLKHIGGGSHKKTRRR